MRDFWVGLSIVMALLTITPVAYAYLAPSIATPHSGGRSGSSAAVHCGNPCYIVIKNSVYGNGQTVVIAKGTQVVWVNDDDTPHTATSNTGVWDTGIIRIGKSSQPVTFDEDGTYPYFCLVHPMSGVIIVVG